MTLFFYNHILHQRSKSLILKCEDLYMLNFDRFYLGPILPDTWLILHT